LIFHLLEQVSLAVRNICCNDQLASNHDLMTGVLREMGSACLVVNRDLKILHANKTARRFFSKSSRAAGDLEFTDVPANARQQSLSRAPTGTAVARSGSHPNPSPAPVYQSRLFRSNRQPGDQPASALLIADDLTQSEQLRRLEVETVISGSSKPWPNGLAHEVGNALVPLSHPPAVAGGKISRPGFPRVASTPRLPTASTVTRLVQQCAFSRRTPSLRKRRFPSSRSSRKPIRRRANHLPAQPALLHCDTNGSSMVITGDRARAQNTRSPKSSLTRSKPTRVTRGWACAAYRLAR